MGNVDRAKTFTAVGDGPALQRLVTAFRDSKTTW